MLLFDLYYSLDTSTFEDVPTLYTESGRMYYTYTITIGDHTEYEKEYEDELI